jgi:molybdenum cofactor cytidylyltransferase
VIAGIILAAGTSSRLGRPKQLLELDGRPLLQHVVDAMAGASLDELVVVLGHEAARIEAALELPGTGRVVVNPDYGSGQAASLRAGIAALDPAAEAAVVVLGDQPRLTPDLVTRALDAFATAGVPVIRSVYGGVPGHPVVVARSEFAAIARVRGDRGARSVWSASPELVHEEAMGDAPLEDVDTWESYERLLRGA